jgi:hypothetical protein
MEQDGADIESNILQIVTDYYLNSGDFNGISAHELSVKAGVDWSDLSKPLAKLISNDLIGVLYSDVEINPHIVRVGFEGKQSQINKLETEEVFHTCIYPLKKHLEQVVDRSEYLGRPYVLDLALGSTQLAFRSFNLTVLEQYRNDPRYRYSNDDVRGTISAVDESLADRDKVILEHFGISYDDELNRAVAVFVGDLAELSPEHQQIWKVKEIEGNYLLHPDFYRNAILGEWGEKISIFDAFVQEIWVINQMSQAMGRQPLFHRDYGEYGENKPKKFSFLIRPTLEEFNSFVLLLDQMLSENINKDFFQNEIPAEEEVEREDGRIEVNRRGTIQILDLWVRKYYRPVDWEPWDTTIATLRQVRKKRQKPAHKADENVFDQEYFKQQRELIMQAYEALRTLRLILANHPQVKKADIRISKVLQQGDIWTY